MKKAFFRILSVLTLALIGLRLTNLIDWNWWWIFSPVWIVVLYFVLMTIVSQCYLIYQYKHDEQFRKIMDEHRAAKKREKEIFAEKLKEIKEKKLAETEKRNNNN